MPHSFITGPIFAGFLAAVYRVFAFDRKIHRETGRKWLIGITYSFIARPFLVAQSAILVLLVLWLAEVRYTASPEYRIV